MSLHHHHRRLMLQSQNNNGQPAKALDIEGLEKTLPDRGRGAQGRRSRDRGGRVLRPARPQRRRQVDPDPLHDRARAADRRARSRSSATTRSTTTATARQAVGLAPQELNLDWFLTVEETLDYHAGYFGMPKKERRERAAELLETFSLYREAQRAHAHALGRDEAPADPRPGADAPPAAADPRRADRRASTSSCASSSGTTCSGSTTRARRSCSPRTTSRRPSSSATGSPSSTRARSSPRARAASWPTRFGVANLEDAYLELVGRKELSRSRSTDRERSRPRRDDHRARSASSRSGGARSTAS